MEELVHHIGSAIVEFHMGSTLVVEEVHEGSVEEVHKGSVEEVHKGSVEGVHKGSAVVVEDHIGLAHAVAHMETKFKDLEDMANQGYVARQESQPMHLGHID